MLDNFEHNIMLKNAESTHRVRYECVNKYKQFIMTKILRKKI